MREIHTPFVNSIARVADCNGVSTLWWRELGNPGLPGSECMYVLALGLIVSFTRLQTIQRWHPCYSMSVKIWVIHSLLARQTQE